MYPVKRRYKRYVVQGMDFRARTIFDTEIELLDISLGGARIKSQRSLKMGTNYLIKLLSEKALLSLKCDVKWEVLSGSIKDGTHNIIPIYTIGIEFKDIPSNKLEQLKNFMKIVGLPDEQPFVDEKRLSGLRFKIKSKEMAIIDGQDIYIVKKISLGGMRIESNYEIQIDNRYPMELFFPDDKIPIKFQGRVASCIPIPDKSPESHDTGIEFLDIEEEDRERLRTFIQSLHET